MTKRTKFLIDRRHDFNLEIKALAALYDTRIMHPAQVIKAVIRKADAEKERAAAARATIKYIVKTYPEYVWDTAPVAVPPAPANLVLPPKTIAAMHCFLRAGNLIEAVKVCREQADVSLADAATIAKRMRLELTSPTRH